MTYSGFKELSIEFNASITTKALSQRCLTTYQFKQIQKIIQQEKE